MTAQQLFNLLANSFKCDLMFNTDADTSNGVKLSLQGKSVADAVALYSALASFLLPLNIPFKVATSKRFSLANKEQSRKAMTIYIPNGMDAMQIAEDVYSLTMDYNGWNDIATPTSYEHYAGCVFFRNDRDENGRYVPAN
jgi:hypothetical protein